ARLACGARLPRAQPEERLMPQAAAEAAYSFLSSSGWICCWVTIRAGWERRCPCGDAIAGHTGGVPGAAATVGGPMDPVDLFTPNGFLEMTMLNGKKARDCTCGEIAHGGSPFGVC